jgi:hypothetical protein
MENITIKNLLGKTLVKVIGKKGDGEIQFVTTEGEKFYMYHQQDCCESVLVEDICGDMDDLVGSPIVQADEETNRDESLDYSMTWTFYRLATAKGQVVIRWLGTSNGFYSESVDFVKGI